MPAKFEVEFLPSDTVPEANLDRAELIRWLNAIFEHVAISEFSVTLNGSPPPGYKRYDYHVETADGRTWDQQLLLHDPPNGEPPRMTFDVPAPGWHLDEFTALRPVRDFAIALLNTFPAITSITAEWN